MATRWRLLRSAPLPEGWLELSCRRQSCAAETQAVHGTNRHAVFSECWAHGVLWSKERAPLAACWVDSRKGSVSKNCIASNNYC